MNKKWQISAALILMITLLLLGYLIVRDLRREQQVKAILEQVAQPGDRFGRGSDPYQQGPVRNRIIKGYPALQGCYQEYLKKEPKLTDGQIKLDWQVDESGSVIEPEVVQSPFQDTSLHECLKQEIKGWKFPEPLVKKYVEHIFKFNKK